MSDPSRGSCPESSCSCSGVHFDRPRTELQRDDERDQATASGGKGVPTLMRLRLSQIVLCDSAGHVGWDDRLATEAIVIRLGRRPRKLV